MYIKLERLDQLCKNDEEKKKKFLQQFLDLVPKGIHQLKNDLKKLDRMKVRKTIHFLAPQLTFFGIPDFSVFLQKLDAEPQIPLEQLIQPISQSILKINKAILEVQKILGNNN